MDHAEYQIKFTAIVPTYNRCELLKIAVDSVLNQTYPNWELIIVVDGATDNTETYLKSITDDRIRTFYQDKGERSKARNLGIEMASGDYVLFLDDDDYLLPDHLMQFFRAINDHTESNTIFRTGYLREENGQQKAVENFEISKHEHPVKFATYHMSGIWTLCIPRHLLALDVFPEEFPHWQDTHLVLRLLAKYQMRQLPVHTYVYRLHANMGSRQHLDEHQLLEKAEINTAAVHHFFSNHHALVAPHLKSTAESFLIAEKWLQYASRALRLGHRQAAKFCYQQAVGFNRELFKYRLLFWLHWIFGGR
ncbi:MAG: glycosyltransferase [Saprospiraceae bacterium]|nr:glycosyltransferase [Saprospiraceae bacterium]